jgi:hypothetical protein
MSLQLDVPTLDLPEPELQARFDALQRRLVPLWRAIESLEDDGAQTIVVVPSLTVDFAALQGSLLQAYEERFLFLLLLLRQPNARLIYLSSQPIHPHIVDYYLGLLPGVISSHARQRLFLLAPHDLAAQPLSAKLLQRPRLLQRIRSLIDDPTRAHLVPFNTTVYERDLALRLGIPMFGADPRHLELGTKSGCRRLFAEAGIAHPLGYEGLDGVDSLVDAVLDMRARDPRIDEAMVKHDDGVSGEGNAVLDLRGLDATSRDAVRERLARMRLESKSMNQDTFLRKLADGGGILEQRVVGERIVSPSAQLRITPTGEVELLSTHDQLLGGAEGQKYVGCVFPADPAYAARVGHEALRLGPRLAERGVLGRFAVDFVCAEGPEGYQPYAIEVNLRKGGTTHPYLTLQFLTDGHYEADPGAFRTKGGQPKHYVASDDLSDERYRVLSPDDLFDVAVRRDLHWDPTTQTGVVFHMLSALGDHGRLGLTAVADTREGAHALYGETQRALDTEARLAATHSPLPEPPGGT